MRPGGLRRGQYDEPARCVKRGPDAGPQSWTGRQAGLITEHFHGAAAIPRLRQTLQAALQGLGTRCIGTVRVRDKGVIGLGRAFRGGNASRIRSRHLLRHFSSPLGIWPVSRARTPDCGDDRLIRRLDMAGPRHPDCASPLPYGAVRFPPDTPGREQVLPHAGCLPLLRTHLRTGDTNLQPKIGPVLMIWLSSSQYRLALLPVSDDCSPWRPGRPVMAQCKLGRPAMGSDDAREVARQPNWLPTAIVAQPYPATLSPRNTWSDGTSSLVRHHAATMHNCLTVKQVGTRSPLQGSLTAISSALRSRLKRRGTAGCAGTGRRVLICEMSALPVHVLIRSIAYSVLYWFTDPGVNQLLGQPPIAL